MFDDYESNFNRSENISRLANGVPSSEAKSMLDAIANRFQSTTSGGVSVIVESVEGSVEMQKRLRKDYQDVDFCKQT